MERVGTLVKKLQEQLEAQISASQMLITVQMLQAELYALAGKETNPSLVSVFVPPTPAVEIPPNIQIEPKEEPTPVEEPEKTVEILQVDEAEIEAELEQIKKHAEEVHKLSAHHKPIISFDEEIEIPTLIHQQIPDTKKEINESVQATASLNDKLKQGTMDLGDTLIESPVRDLKKAIGVNDKFLFIKELFRNDESMYERSIKTINNFSILPEAEYWIQRELKVKLGWDDNSEAVKAFAQLVRRRFS